MWEDYALKEPNQTGNQSLFTVTLISYKRNKKIEAYFTTWIKESIAEIWKMTRNGLSKTIKTDLTRLIAISYGKNQI